MKYPLLLFFLSLLTPLYSQEYQYFYYESNKEQYFRFHPGAFQKKIYVKMDKSDILFNTIFQIDNDTKKLLIPQSGFYEISGYFHFDLRTGNVKNSRAGINFGFVQIKNGVEEYIASTRISYTESNQDGFTDIHIVPTIVYLEQGVTLAPAMSTGLLDKPILNGFLGCKNNDKNCVAFRWNIKKISNEESFQKYF